MKKPTSYKIFQTFCWIQIAFAVLMSTVAIITISFKADSGFWYGFQGGLANRTSASSLVDYDAKNAGEFVGQMLMTLVPSLLALWFAAKGQRIVMIICLAVELVIAFNVVPIVGLIVAFIPAFKYYLNYLKGGTSNAA